MLQKAEADGFKTFGGGYTRVSEAAKTLGKGEDFKHFNKLLSKFAHPTALTLIGNSGGYEMELRQKFYDLGKALGRDILRDLPNRP